MDHPLWPAFVIYACNNGINEEDWLAWWECFLAGAQAQQLPTDEDE